MVKESHIDVEPEHLTLVKKILKWHIAYKTVWAYGSRVNWTANQYSNLDLVVFEVSTVKLGERGGGVCLLITVGCLLVFAKILCLLS